MWTYRESTLTNSDRKIKELQAAIDHDLEVGFYALAEHALFCGENFHISECNEPHWTDARAWVVAREDPNG